MCLITHATFTLCPHVKRYTDRTAYHPSYFGGVDPSKCKKAKINEVKIEGVCGECLERGLDIGDRKNGEEVVKLGGRN
jgi:hypothetical protein